MRDDAYVSNQADDAADRLRVATNDCPGVDREPIDAWCERFGASDEGLRQSIENLRVANDLIAGEDRSTCS